MSFTAPQALTDAELDQLESLLDSPAFGGESMTLDALQGFICAVASAPEPILPSDWMPIALGSKTHFESEAQAQAFMDLLLRFYDQQVAALQGEGAASLIVYRDEASGEDDLDTWCQGYLEGVDLSPRAWEEAGDPDEVDELLFPFLVLTGELSEEVRSRIAAKDWGKLLEACRDDIWATAVDAHRYWRTQRERPATVQREQPKVGRNDPCPCGSGKTFKLCCGAPHSLH